MARSSRRSVRAIAAKLAVALSLVAGGAAVVPLTATPAAASPAPGIVTPGTSVTITPTETGAFTGTVASFTDSDTAKAAADFSATIDWGDGTTSSGTVTGSNGSFSVGGTHNYAEDGPHTGLVTLTETVSGNRATSAFTAHVGEGSFTLSSGSGVTVAEGAQFSGTVATLVDGASPDPASDFSASIDWGDGTTTAGTVTGVAGTFTVTGQHVWTDEGAFPVTVTIAEPEANFVLGPVGFHVTVTEADALTARPLTFDAVPGSSYSGLVASFTDTHTDAPPSDFTATIDWGDGTTTAGTVGGGGGVLTVAGTHTYAAGTTLDQPVHVTLTDDAPGTATATANSTGHPVAVPRVAPGNAVTITPGENQSFTGTVANFTDSDPTPQAGDFSVTIDWGDGTTSGGTVSGSNGDFSVSGTHTYAEDGPHTGLVTLTEAFANGTQATTAFTANVGEGFFALGAASSFSVAEGTPFSGPVATFQDPSSTDPASDFTATIDWGDGTTSPGTVTGSGGNFTVTGNHVYADEGRFLVLVTVSEPEANFNLGPVSFHATVTEADALTARPLTFDAVPGSSYSGLVASFTDTYTDGPPSDFTAAIDWGDGTTTAGTVGGGGGVLTVAGTHTYSAALTGDQAVNVTLTDDSPGTATATATSTAHLLTVADLQITKTDGTATAAPGGTDTYTITVTNAGPSAVTAAQVADSFPVDFTNVSYTSSVTGGATGNTANGLGNINDTVNMPPGSTITYSATGTISPSATGTLTNTATVNAPSGVIDTNQANNSATDTDNIAPQSDLSVTKSGPSSATPGSDVTYTVTVANNGPSAAPSATLTDPLPAGTTLVSVTPPAGWACPSPPSVAVGSNGTVTCSTTAPFAVNPAGVVFTIVAHVNPSFAGQLSNTSSVTPSDQDPNAGNNTTTPPVGTNVACPNVITGNVPGTLKLTSGTTCVIGATVGGSIKVSPGASLIVSGANVHGSIVARSPNQIVVCGSTVGGSVNIRGATGFVLLGDPADDNCPGNHFSRVLLTSDHGGVEVSQNSIVGSLTLNGSSGVGPFPEDAQPEVEANTIGGNLRCSSNVPGVANNSSPNTVTGRITGQCVGL